MQPLWLYLHFPNLQLDSYHVHEGAENKGYIDGTGNHKSTSSIPIVILDTAHGIVQLNKCARQAGIQPFMSLGTAAALHGGLQVIPFNPEIEKQQLSIIAQRLYMVVSDICFFSEQGLLLRVHNMLRLYSSLNELWSMIKSQFVPLNVSFSFATGHSPLAAKLLAVKGWNQITDEPAAIQHALKKVDLSLTELSSKDVTKLNSIGVKSVEQLLIIPFSDLHKRFDTQMITYLGQLRGDFKHPVIFFHPQANFKQYIELLYEIERTDLLLKPIQKLLSNLENFLLLRDELTQELRIILYQRDKSKIEFTVGAQQGEYRAKDWLGLLALKLENVLLNAPIIALQLSTGKTFVRHPDKQDLFLGKQGVVSRLQLISALQAKLGDDVLFSPQTINDYRPERASQYCSVLTVNERNPIYRSPLRPSFLLAEPSLLTQHVSIVRGPERISTGWWDQQPVLRDYFIAVSKEGQWFWVFKTPENTWFLQGIFS